MEKEWRRGQFNSNTQSLKAFLIIAKCQGVKELPKSRGSHIELKVNATSVNFLSLSVGDNVLSSRRKQNRPEMSQKQAGFDLKGDI